MNPDSPPLAIVCPHCPRHFRSKGGRTKHIRVSHQVESEPQELNPSVPPSPIPYLSSHPPSPIPSDYTSSPPSNFTPPPFNNVLPSADHESSPVSDYLPPPSHGGAEFPAINPDAEDDLDAAPGMNDPQIIDASVTTCDYHPELDGKSFFSPRYGMH